MICGQAEVLEKSVTAPQMQNWRELTETMRPSPSRRKEYWFAIGGGRSVARANTRSDPATSAAMTIDPGSEPDYDEDDDWPR